MIRGVTLVCLLAFASASPARADEAAPPPPSAPTDPADAFEPGQSDDAPVAEETPVDGETPGDEDAPADDEAPASAEAPADEETPGDEDAPVDDETQANDEQRRRPLTSKERRLDGPAAPYVEPEPEPAPPPPRPKADLSPTKKAPEPVPVAPSFAALGGGLVGAALAGVACAGCGFYGCASGTAMAGNFVLGAFVCPPLLLLGATWTSASLGQTLAVGFERLDLLFGQQVISIVVGLAAGVAAIPIATVASIVSFVFADLALGVSSFSAGVPSQEGMLAGAIGAGIGVFLVGVAAAVLHTAMLYGLGLVFADRADPEVEARAPAARPRRRGLAMAY